MTSRFTDNATGTVKKDGKTKQKTTNISTSKRYGGTRSKLKKSIIHSYNNL